MSPSFEYRLESNPLIDNVVFALAPINAFTGRVVAKEVKARIDGLTNKPIRNLSGLLVFVNLPAQVSYQVHMTASDAGYLDPEVVTVTLPLANLRVDVPLYRQPSATFDPDSTIVAGKVVRAGQDVPGARVWAELPGSVSILIPPPVLQPFETRSDGRGAFALPLRAGGASSIKFRFRHGADQRELDRAVIEGKFQSFEEPIDLVGTNSPPLVLPMA